MNTSIRFEFDAYYVGEQNEQELRKSKNPFAHVILTALMAIKNNKKPVDQVFAYKRMLIKNLLQAGFDDQEISSVLNFIKLYVSFGTKKLNAKFEQEFIHLTNKNPKTMEIKEIHKRFEQVLIDEAKEEGKQEGEKIGKRIAKKETLLDTAKRMFKEGLDILMVHKCTGLSIKELNTLSRNIH